MQKPRRNSYHWIMSLAVVSTLAVGCALQPNRDEVVVRRMTTDPGSVQFVKDLTRPWGLKWVEGEAVSLVVGLNGSGSDPLPSSERSMMQDEMRVREVHNADAVLASSNTSLVIARAMIPPGAQKGDRVDLEVRVPKRSETEDLNGGWMMLARLKEYARLNNRLAEGHVLAMGQGSILVDSLMEGQNDPVFKTRGRILGGGIVSKSRKLGLRIRDEDLSVRTSVRIGEAINRRFHVYDRGDRKGVATPKKDSFVDLVVHPRYKKNLVRYLRVIQNIPVRESSTAMIERLHLLKSNLLNPTSSSAAAVALEAIGADGVPVLKEGLNSPNPEVRFYAAEALAYMDDPEAALVLSDAIRDVAAFRRRGFLALGAMDDIAAQDVLLDLLNERSAETRYGAFRTLRRLSPNDPGTRGEVLNGKFNFHTIASAADPLVHVSKHERPEIVVFGGPVPVEPPTMIFAGKFISIRHTEDGRLRVRRLATDDNDDQQQLVAATLEAMVRSIVDLGGKYPEVVQAIAEARRHKAITCRLEYSAIADAGRKYMRRSADENEGDSEMLHGDASDLTVSDREGSEAAMDVGQTSPLDADLSAELAAGANIDYAAGDSESPVSLVSDEDLDGLILFKDGVDDPIQSANPAPVIDALRR